MTAAESVLGGLAALPAKDRDPPKSERSEKAMLCRSPRELPLLLSNLFNHAAII